MIIYTSQSVNGQETVAKVKHSHWTDNYVTLDDNYYIHGWALVLDLKYIQATVLYPNSALQMETCMSGVR